MAEFQQSPGVQVQEKNASGITPGASTTVGGFSGQYTWGPIDSPMLIDNEETLVSVFGSPTNESAKHFFPVANFLSYTSACWVNRVAKTTINTASVVSGVPGSTLYSSGTTYALNDIVYVTDNTLAPTYVLFYKSLIASNTSALTVAASWELQTSLTYEIAQNATSVTGTYDFFNTTYNSGSYVSDGLLIKNLSAYQSLTNPTQAFAARYAGELGNGLIVSIADSATYATWTYKNYFNTITSTEHVHVIVIDALGKFTGTPGAVLEKYAFLSKAGNAISYQGTSNYYKSVIEAKSQYIYALAQPPASINNWGSNVGTTFGLLTGTTFALVGGVNGTTVSDGDISSGFTAMVNSDEYDISLFFTGNASINLSKLVKDNVGDVRRDCLVFVTVVTSTGAMIDGTTGTAIADATGFKTAFGNTTYAVIDSSYKYQYDKYNDVYRWIACNADTAGLCARVDKTHDTWISPAGTTKGQIKGAIKLSWNPRKADRNVIYPLSINPIVTMVGEGTFLFGDRTATTEPSAFDRINVRRLFLILEKSISKSARHRLFDQNDAVTRSLWKSQTEPLLRDAQGRRGIEAYRVICDETNNTPAVRAANEFRGKILIKPLYSINFISLTFTAVGPDVSFEIAAGV